MGSFTDNHRCARHPGMGRARRHRVHSGLESAGASHTRVTVSPEYKLKYGPAGVLMDRVARLGAIL